MSSRLRVFAMAARCLILASAVAVGIGQAQAQSCISIIPASYTLNFGSQGVGTTTPTKDFEITNLCSAPVQVNSFSMTGAPFILLGGWAPTTINEGHNMLYEIRFAPTAAQAYSGTATLNVQGYSPIVVTMNGTGFLPDASIAWSTSSLTFNNVPVGSTSTQQTLQMTNKGSKSVTITNIYADAPFAVSGFTPNQTLKAGASLTFPVTFAPSYPGSFNGTVVVTTNTLPPTGVTLYATAVAPSALAISNYPTLPPLTQGAAYLVQLLSMNGIGTVTWSLASGSILPAGLSLSSSGSITGTLSSSAPLGNSYFTVTATDSDGNTASAALTLPIEKPSPASCDYIDWDVPGTSTPMVPVTDLGTGTFLGAQGGLYLNGSNIMPATHDSDGLNFANSIQPLDANGNPDPNGKYALMSLGMSVTFDTFQKFMQDAGADPSTNSHLVFVPAAQPRLGAVDWANLSGPAWTDTFEYFLPQAGVTPQQVVAAWVEAVDSNPHGAFPANMATLQSEYETIAQILHTEFPNLVLAFFSSREYGAYSYPNTGNPEPYAYETAFAVRGMIQDQLNGVAAMNYKSADGPVMAPWVAWGPYLWANGLLARSDGLVWPCYYFEGDGLHPSESTGGSEQDANMLLRFMKTDDVTIPWFLAP